MTPRKKPFLFFIVILLFSSFLVTSIPIRFSSANLLFPAIKESDIVFDLSSIDLGRISAGYDTNFTFPITNQGDTSVNVTVIVDPEHQGASWISFDTSKVPISPIKTNNLTIFVTLPANASPGKYDVPLIFNSSYTSTGGGAGVTFKQRVNLSFIVPGIAVDTFYIINAVKPKNATIVLYLSNWYDTPLTSNCTINILDKDSQQISVLYGADVTMDPNRGGSWTFDIPTSELPEGNYTTSVETFVQNQTITLPETLSEEVYLYILVDSNPPLIGLPEVNPTKPTYSDTVTLMVNITDQEDVVTNASIYYTIDNWATTNYTQPLPYNSTTGKWVVALPVQPTETTVKYYFVAYDDTGNRAKSTQYIYTVEMPIDFTPIIIVAAGLALVTIIAVMWRKRRNRRAPSS